MSSTIFTIMDIAIAVLAFLLVLIITKNSSSCAKFSAALKKFKKLAKEGKHSEADLVMIEILEPILKKNLLNPAKESHRKLVIEYHDAKLDFIKKHRR